jgi:hypothetical protein
LSPPYSKETGAAKLEKEQCVDEALTKEQDLLGAAVFLYLVQAVVLHAGCDVKES